ncbi:hypothetical protein Ping_2565 [Psychromonas ingrahamii 37]|uniref:Uncharacterized protein n=1 Tax=Psychromonas ingrahamii (strain DSM 17664 / CCUG 51855 / 37) TaxID=357804 RepID=A1SXS1_PSYIN|nr:hypothetical protein [Psychromonas ingrahamii]ABM04286.1 hypothetical protein Ping_2565 [Psychromonas ingrahamii 37]
MNILNFILNLLKHPITAIVVSISLTIVVYKLSIVVKEPVFAIKPPILLVQNQTGSNRLKVTWDDIPVENVYSVEVAIWNKGNDYIDFENVVKSSPIKIMPTNKVNILNVKRMKVSGPKLELNGKIIEDIGTKKAILINIKNDEVLEHLDGSVFHILYSSNQEVGWMVKGRIKGIPEGFIEEDDYPTKPTSQTWYLSIAAFSLEFLLFLLVITSQFFLQKKDLNPRWWLFPYNVVLSVLVIYWLFASVFPFLFYPEWLIM